MIVIPVVLLGVGFLVFLVFLLSEKQRRMIQQMLPPEVIRELELGKPYAQLFSSTTVLFADIVSYTVLSSELSPKEVVELLGIIFSEFDRMVDKHGLYKTGTVGESPSNRSLLLSLGVLLSTSSGAPSSLPSSLHPLVQVMHTSA